MSAAYEARVLSAYLPFHSVAFIFPKRGIPMQSGIFRIEYVRQATSTDKAEFPLPKDGVCALCGRREDEQ